MTLVTLSTCVFFIGYQLVTVPLPLSGVLYDTSGAAATKRSRDFARHIYAIG